MGLLRCSRAFRHAIACLALAALTLGAFSNALRAGFVSFDDWMLIEENARIRSLSLGSLAEMFASKEPQSHAWLPLRELSYALDYRLWGLLPTGYHLTNVLLHAANAMLAYAVLVWLFGSAECGVRSAGGLAWLGAAIFAVHPAQVESVAWASGRRDVLYAFFFLLAFLAFVAHERRAGWQRWTFYGLSLACLAASLLSKSSAMALPAVLGLAILAFGEGGRRLWERLAATLPHWAVAIVLSLVHLLVARDAGVVKGRAFSASLANVPFIFAKYLELAFFPVHLATPYGYMTLRWSTDGARILLLAGGVGAVVAAAWWAAPRRSLAFFCIGWWFILLLPVANFIPISVLVADRYLYLPLLGACGLAAGVAGSLAGARWRRAAMLACAAAVIGFFGLGAWGRSRAWENSRRFWQDGVSKWPNTPLVRIGLATAYADANELEKAWEQYMMVALSWGRAASSDPEHVSLVLRGVAVFYDRFARDLEARGRHQAALEVYESVVRLAQEEKKSDPWARLAQAYERRGLWAKAREAAMWVQKLDPDYPGLAEWLSRLAARQAELPGDGPRE